jgi:hypothetical protein
MSSSRPSPAAASPCSKSLHWLRDTHHREDNSTVRTPLQTRAMATPRNLAVEALHQASRHDTAEAAHWPSRYVEQPFTILGSRHDLETAVYPTWKLVLGGGRS